MKRGRRGTTAESKKNIKLTEEQIATEVISSEEENHSEHEEGEQKEGVDEEETKPIKKEQRPGSKEMIRLLEIEFSKISDKTKAKGMKKYMRDQFEFLGIQSQDRRKAQSAVFSKFPIFPLQEVCCNYDDDDFR
jgi:hypothetical protein